MLTEIFNVIAGITLFLFAIHYICYIVQAISVSGNSKTTRSIAMQSEDAKFIKKWVFSPREFDE